MRLVTVPIEEDLAPYSRHLWLQRIPHRVFAEGGQQVLELARAEDAARARADYDAWRAGQLALAHPDALSVPPLDPHAKALWQRAPMVLLLIALAGLVFLLTGGGQVAVSLLTIVDLNRAGDGLLAALGRGEVWRPLSPILLHFSVPHLLFNAAVVFEVGRRVEAVDGWLRFALLVVLLGVLSNLVQYLLGEGPAFGGLSGVAYGLVGFVLMRARLQPAEVLWQLPGGIAIGLLIFLVLFSTGITEPFGLRVANGAHWGGLVAGVVLALPFAALARAGQRPPEFHS